MTAPLAPQHGRPLVLAALAAALAASRSSRGVAFGAVPVAARRRRSARSAAGVTGAPRAGMTDALVLDLRLPRVLLAALVGMCLAGAGVLYQALFRNPLADPYILGVCVGRGTRRDARARRRRRPRAIAALRRRCRSAAFVGAVGDDRARGRRRVARAGGSRRCRCCSPASPISYTLAAVTSFVMVFSRQTMQQVVFWMMGGLQAASWGYVARRRGRCSSSGSPCRCCTRGELNIMLLGDERAGQLGVDVERFKLRRARRGVAAGGRGRVGLGAHRLRRAHDAAHGAARPRPGPPAAAAGVGARRRRSCSCWPTSSRASCSRRSSCRWAS